MKDTVLKLAVQIRERIKDTPPQIVESTSALILMDIATTIYESGLIDRPQYWSMQNEIKQLYNV